MAKRGRRPADPRKALLRDLENVLETAAELDGVPRKIVRDLENAVASMQRVTAAKSKTPIQQKKDAVKQLEQQREDAKEQLAIYEAMRHDDAEKHVQT